MKKKKIVIGIGIVVAATALCIGGIAIFKNNSSNGVLDNIESNKDINGKDIITIDDDGNISYSYTNEDILAAQNYMNTYNHIAIELMTNEYVYDDKNNLEKSTMTGRYLSEMYLDQKTADTRDFTNYKSGQLWDEMPMVDFKETFGFNFTEYDKAFDLVIAFLNAQKINIDLDNATINEGLFNEYGEKWYSFKDASTITQYIMSGIEYDTINSSSCSYVLSKDNTGNLYLEYFTATVNYTKDDKNISKCITCSFYLFIDDENASNGCTCGSDTDCNTGKNNGINCYTDCDIESLDCD